MESKLHFSSNLQFGGKDHLIKLKKKMLEFNFIKTAFIFPRAKFDKSHKKQ